MQRSELSTTGQQLRHGKPMASAYSQLSSEDISCSVRMVENTTALPAVALRSRSSARYSLFWVWLTRTSGTHAGTAVVVFCGGEVANIVVLRPLGGVSSGD